MSYPRPGVFVEETLRPSPPPSGGSSDAIGAFVAPHHRGPLEATVVNSWSQYERLYGGFPDVTSRLPYAINSYFANGGTSAVVIRVVGAGAASADVVLEDTGSTADDTLEFEAANPGTWGNKIAIGVTLTGDDTFTVFVYFGGTSPANIVERFQNLSMNPEAPNYVDSVINSVSRGSNFVRSHTLGSANFDPNDPDYAVIRPAATGSPVSLANGSNGADPTAGDISGVLTLLEEVDAPKVLNFPGIYDSTVLSDAINYAQTTREVFVVVDPEPGLDAGDTVTWAGSLPSSSFAAVYYPWINVSDPNTNTRGATRLVPPGAAVVGTMVSTDQLVGPWKAPAGLSTRLSGVVSTEFSLTNDDLDALLPGHVNPIKHSSGSGFVIWGARTLRSTGSDIYVPIRRTMIYLTHALKERTKWATFEPNDETLWGLLESQIESFLSGVWQLRGLSGSGPGTSFFVKCDEETNTPNSIEAGIVNIEIGVALQYPAEFIVIKLAQWEGGSSADDNA